MKYIIERKAVRRTKRKHDRIFRRCRLQLEIKLPTEALPQRQSPRTIQTTAERRVQHELHTPAIIKKSFQDEIVLRRHHTQHDLRPREILNDLLRRRLRYPHLSRQPLLSRLEINPRSVFIHVNPLRHFLAQPRNRDGQLVRPCRGFTQPERNRGGLTVRILDSHFALLYSQHTPRSVSELKDVALQTLDRKVFINCADNEIARL